MATKLTLKYPVKPYIKNQNFGDSMACCEDNGLPVTQRKIVTKIGATCPPGYTELYPVLMMKGHTGMDMHAPDGIPCYYTAPDGIVEEIQTEPERGLGLGIITLERFLFIPCVVSGFSGGEYHAKTRYWHLKGFSVKKGDIVKTGQLIGWCDNTGLSSGSHLHFELKPVDKNSRGKWYNVST